MYINFVVLHILILNVVYRVAGAVSDLKVSFPFCINNLYSVTVIYTNGYITRLTNPTECLFSFLLLISLLIRMHFVLTDNYFAVLYLKLLFVHTVMYFYPMNVYLNICRYVISSKSEFFPPTIKNNFFLISWWWSYAYFFL